MKPTTRTRLARGIAVAAGVTAAAFTGHGLAAAEPTTKTNSTAAQGSTPKSAHRSGSNAHDDAHAKPRSTKSDERVDEPTATPRHEGRRQGMSTTMRTDGPRTAPFTFVLRDGEFHDWALGPLTPGAMSVRPQIYDELVGIGDDGRRPSAA